MIEVQNFHKTYGDTIAVNNLSFFIEPGQVLGLVGPNGAGKTTTLRALCGIIPPTMGTLRIGAKDIDLACALAAEAGVPAPLLQATAQVLQEAMRLGLGEADLAALARAIERRAGVSFNTR